MSRPLSPIPAPTTALLSAADALLVALAADADADPDPEAVLAVVEPEALVA